MIIGVALILIGMMGVGLSLVLKIIIKKLGEIEFIVSGEKQPTKRVYKYDFYNTLEVDGSWATFRNGLYEFEYRFDLEKTSIVQAFKDFIERRTD
jgi:hypothetical protein